MTDVEQIKAKIDIIDFISEYIQLKKTGRNFKALCPFHPEKTPSFVVSAERQSWHCFGACNTGGDVVSFLEKWENIEFLEALKTLAKRAGVILSHYEPTDSTKLREKLYEINHLASEFFYYLLTSHKLGFRGRDYLSSRHIKAETAKTFMLGYAPESWDSLLRYLVKKGYSETDIYTAGLVVRSEAGRYYDRFRGRLMFTLKDHRGNTVGFSGRKLPPQTEKEAKYVNTAETPIYSKGNILYGLDVTREAIKREKKAIVVEGEFDLLSSYQAGVTNVTAIKGSALTAGQTLLLKRYTENLVLALDSDFAGNEAARRGIEIAEAANLNVKVVSLPFGKDPADCVEKGAHLWKDAVSKAISIYDFVIKVALEKYDRSDALGKKKIGIEVVPFLAKIANPIVQSHYIKYLTTQLEVSEESIISSIRLFAKKETSVELSSISSSALPDRSELLEEHFLSLIIQSARPDQSLASVMTIVTMDDFYIPPVAKIIQQLLLYFKKHKKLHIKEFAYVLTSEVVPTFDRAFMGDIGEILGDEKTFHHELTFTAVSLKKISLRRTINNLSTKIRQLEEEGKEEEAKNTNEKVRQLLTAIGELEKDSVSPVQ